MPTARIFGILLILAAGAFAFPARAQAKAEAESPRQLSPPEGKRLAEELLDDVLSRAPAENTSAKGMLKIRPASGPVRTVPFSFRVTITETNWQSVYEADLPGSEPMRTRLVITHARRQSNQYTVVYGDGPAKALAGNELMTPFAGSDFWVADLGLDFLHWPQQRVVTSEMRRGQSCRVLESTNPNPAPGAYSRVVCWVDIDSCGIVHADAYDHRGQILKQFDPKEFRKVKGEWQLEQMEIRNRQTNTRTRIEFDLSR
jgi:hypothetical protein